jgi:hypothetical protein
MRQFTSFTITKLKLALDMIEVKKNPFGHTSGKIKPYPAIF